MSLKQGCTEEERDAINRQHSAFTGREVRDEEERGDESEDTGIEKCKKEEWVIMTYCLCSSLMLIILVYS